MGPGPETVIVRICDGNGTGNHPVNGTNSGTVYPSHQAVADRTVMLNRELSFSSCSEIGRNHEISCNTKKKRIVLFNANLVYVQYTRTK